MAYSVMFLFTAVSSAKHMIVHYRSLVLILVMPGLLIRLGTGRALLSKIRVFSVRLMSYARSMAVLWMTVNCGFCVVL